VTLLATRTETVGARGRVRVARLGSGPPLLLLHGYPDDLQIFSALAPRLAGAAEVIAFDWPGLGGSDPWPGAVTPAHMADRLRALLDAWGIERASLFGMDMGGQPALAFAARHPQRVRRLVVANALVFPDERTSWEIRLLRRFGWNRFFLHGLPRAVFRRAARTSLCPSDRLPDGVRADFWEHFRRPAVRQFVARMCAAYQGTLDELPPLYPRIACPTLALWAERDRHFPPAHGRRLRDAIPGASLEVVPGACHWMALAHPDAVARSVLDFLAGDR
jgi:pimeloyl-ACP methyl ester carboxylesterase